MEEARRLKVRYTPTAFVQLAEITAYIGARNPRAAVRVHARIRRAIDLLRDFPLSGGRTRNPAIRRITTSPYPYLVFYQATADEIIIHAIRHGARSNGHTLI